MQNRKRDTDVQNRLLDSVGEGKGGMFRKNSIETSILSRMKQIASPGWCMRQVLRAGALGRPRGMRRGGRRERGSGWGTHVNPWLIHVNVCQKPLQYCKVISLQLIKINEKKKRIENAGQHITGVCCAVLINTWWGCSFFFQSINTGDINEDKVNYISYIYIYIYTHIMHIYIHIPTNI